MIHSTPDPDQSNARRDAIIQLIFGNIAQQRAAIDVLGDSDLAELFAQATTHLLERHLLEASCRAARS